jgi:opine dehydrogenase
MVITILGAGNAGCAHACMFAEKGHRVRLVKTSRAIHQENFIEIERTGQITCIDNTQGGRRFTVNPELVTYDIKQAIPGSHAVMVMVQSLYHEDIAKGIGELLEPGQLVLVVPGNMGSVFFRRYSRAPDVLFAEGESTPFDARLIEPGIVCTLFKNVRNALSFLPNSYREEGLKISNRIIETYRYFRQNIVETALHNPNLVLHTIGCIMSASRIEIAKGEFWMYQEGFSPSIWRLVRELDNEKNALLERFGSQRLNYLDACKFRNEEYLSADAHAVFDRYALTGGPKGPSSLNTRYIFEDVPIGLGFMSSLGKKMEIATPLCDSLIQIASVLNDTDYWAQARTLKHLGLEHLSPNELIEYVNI